MQLNFKPVQALHSTYLFGRFRTGGATVVFEPTTTKVVPYVSDELIKYFYDKFTC